MSIKVLYDFVPKDFEINDHLFYWKKAHKEIIKPTRLGGWTYRSRTTSTKRNHYRNCCTRIAISRKAIDFN